MMSMMKSILLLMALPLILAGCTTTNPNSAFDDVDKAVAALTGARLRWSRDDSQRKEIATTVEALLQTNLTAPAAVTSALTNIK